MNLIQRAVLIGLLCFCFTFVQGQLSAQTAQENEPQNYSGDDVMQLLKEQNSKLSSELRRIQREIAALRADLDKPGLKDVFSGIGYIFGLFGTAAYVASRKKG
jgi:nickel transport protein